jgi:hypothetical protein
MAYSIKQNQKKELKKLLSKGVADVRLAVNPRIRHSGSTPLAKKTIFKVTLDQKSVGRPAVTAKNVGVKKKTKRRKK